MKWFDVDCCGGFESIKDSWFGPEPTHVWRGEENRIRVELCNRSSITFTSVGLVVEFGFAEGDRS